MTSPDILFPNHLPELDVSNKIRLRAIDEYDKAELLSLYSDDEILHYIDADRHENIRDSLRFIEECRLRYSENEAIIWAITKVLANRMIGIILLKEFNIKHGYCSVGFLLAKSQWGKGIVLNSLETVLSFAFEVLKLNRVEAQVFVGNAASYRLLEKAGFSREGRLKENFMIKGTYEDAFIYGITAGNYKAMR